MRSSSLWRHSRAQRRPGVCELLVGARRRIPHRRPTRSRCPYGRPQRESKSVVGWRGGDLAAGLAQSLLISHFSQTLRHYIAHAGGSVGGGVCVCVPSVREREGALVADCFHTNAPGARVRSLSQSVLSKAVSARIRGTLWRGGSEAHRSASPTPLAWSQPGIGTEAQRQGLLRNGVSRDG